MVKKVKKLILNVRIEVAIDSSEVERANDMDWIVQSVIPDQIRDGNFKVLDVSVA